MAKIKNTRVLRGIFAPDIHFPKTNWKAFNAMCAFMAENPMDFFIAGGDQLDNQEVSPYTKGKPKLRYDAGTLKRNDKGFDTKVLKPIEKVLPKDAKRIWIDGNHDDWRQQLVNEHPELDGIQSYENLGLEERGWEWVERGKHYQVSPHLIAIHGDSLAGIGNQIPGTSAKKAVDAYVTNVIFGHFHSPQMFTKILPFDRAEKWQAYCVPIIGDTNPIYLQNKPTSWLNGFALVEVLPNGNHNVYLINIINGQFAFGGKVYKG